MYIDMTEEEFEVYLETTPAEFIIDLLMDEGLELKAPEPEISRPERFAQAAKDWVGSDKTSVYHYASGWSTDSWEYVLKAELGEKEFTLAHNIADIKNVFAATVLLAKEAGVEL